MCLQVAILSELATADEAQELFDPRMRGLMIFEVVVLDKALITFIAFVSLGSGVGLHVVVEFLLSEEGPIADLAGVLDRRVNRLLVLLQVQDAFESLATGGAIKCVVSIV